jgi:hypothetical protein
MPSAFGAGRRRWLSRAVRLCWSGVARLPGGQPVLLSQIERSLVDEEFRLDSSFAIFNRSARGQEMPSAEQIPSWSRSLQAGEIPAGALAAVGGAVVLSWLVVLQRTSAAGRATPAGPPASPRTQRGFSTR